MQRGMPDELAQSQAHAPLYREMFRPRCSRTNGKSSVLEEFLLLDENDLCLDPCCGTVNKLEIKRKLPRLVLSSSAALYPSSTITSHSRRCSQSQGLLRVPFRFKKGLL